MTRHEQSCSRDSATGPGVIALALMIVFALIIVANQSAQAQTYTVLYNFTGGQDGANPYAGVTLDKAGNLYGTASAGGVGCGNGCGTVYQLKHKGSGWVFNLLSTFDAGGGAPYDRVVFGPDGALYGTTLRGRNWASKWAWHGFQSQTTPDILQNRTLPLDGNRALCFRGSS